MRSVVITGTSSGIGWGTAKVLIANGLRVFGSVRKTSDAERLAAEFGERFVPLLFDVTDEAAVKAAAADVRRALAGQRLTGLVNNAGVAVAGPLLELPTEEFRRQIDINLIGVVITTKAFAPLIGTDPQLRGPPGRIVNIGSVGGQIGNPFVAPYNASKFALEGLSESLRRELLLFGDRRHRCCARCRGDADLEQSRAGRHRALSRHAVCSGAGAFAKLHAGTRREGFAAGKDRRSGVARTYRCEAQGALQRVADATATLARAESAQARCRSHDRQTARIAAGATLERAKGKAG